MNIKDHYFSMEEYCKLSLAKKCKLCELHAVCGDGSPQKKKKSNKQKEFQTLVHLLSTLTAALANGNEGDGARNQQNDQTGQGEHHQQQQQQGSMGISESQDIKN